MQEVKTKKAKKSFFLRLAVFVFICYVAVMLVNQQMQISEKRKALDDLNQAIKVQELQNDQLGMFEFQGREPGVHRAYCQRRS